jgi:hypothetical protein
MAEAKRAKKKRTKRERKERRFSGGEMQASRVAVGVGVLGGLALGAGVYSQWVSQSPLEYAPFLLAGGAFALGGALIFGDTQPTPVRVGDSGLAIEKGTELSRIGWCDIERVHAENGKLFVKSKDLTFSLPIEAHKRAIAWILAEGTRRVPDVIEVKREAIPGLPEPRDTDGELVTVEDLQVTGRPCAKSGRAISFERDARLCPNCGQAYHHTSVPKRCVTCKAELGDKALSV